jgi:hypothetical protein
MPDGPASLDRVETILLAIAAATTALWVLATAAVFLARRPREPPAGSRELELGPESPAVAGFLAAGFRVLARSVAATLLDLAARRLVEIEQEGLGTHRVRLRTAAHEGLAPHERRVLELLGRLERGGYVPAEALTTGTPEASGRWWRGFRREVVADAKARGLSRDLWDRRTVAILAVPAAVPASLLAVAFGSEPAWAYAAAATAVLLLLGASDRQRDTPAGRAAAERWLGVRAELAQNDVFPTLPPIAVALWERHLAYGAAFGLTPAAVAALPLGAESDHEAWTAYGGTWREVAISYPAVLPLGWGLRPQSALWRGAVLAAGAGFVLYVLSPLLSDRTTLGGVLSGLVLAGAAAGIAAGAVLVTRALADLRSTLEVSGQVLRLRARGDDRSKRRYVAVDDGRANRIRAWVVRPELYAPLAQGQLVTASVTRRLRYVRALAPVTAPDPRSGSAGRGSPGRTSA